MKEKILFLGRFAPPVHGAAVMNEYYFNSPAIKNNFILRKIKINYSKDISQIGKYNLKKIFGTPLAFLTLLKEMVIFRPNLVYFEIAPNGLAFFRDSLFVLLCKIFRRKILFQIHARNLVKNTYSRFIFNNTKIIILSKLLNNEVTGLFNSKEVYILPNGIPNQLTDREFSQLLNKKRQSQKIHLLYLSNMIESKGSLETLKICNSIKGKIDFECLFAGQWQDSIFKDQWFNYLKENNLQKNCKYIGPKYGNEKIELLKKSDFLLFPTKYKNESFPLVILEAMSFGVPTLSYNQGAIKEIISKDFLGYVSEGNFEDLARELTKRSKRKIESRRVRQYFKNNYTLDKASIKLSKIFNLN